MGTNDNLLELFSKHTKAKRDKMNDIDRARFLLQFNTIKGNINYISHVYNLIVQVGLTALKAEPKDLCYTYKHNSNSEMPEQEQESPSRLALFYIQSLIHNFKHSWY
jgi:hypothetical protein